MIYGYTRVSTSEQACDGRSSLEDQERRITGAALMRGGSVDRVFSDPGVSGAVPVEERPAGRQMMTRLVAGDTLIVAKMDRLFRSALDALATAQRLQEHGVKLILADMGTDPVTENGVAKLFFTMLAAFAEFERNRIAERVADGKRAKKAKGGFTGGGAPYGWTKVGDGATASLTRNAGEQNTIAQVLMLRAAGIPLRVISDRLAAAGLKSRNGKPFHQNQIKRIIDSHAASAAS